MLEHLSHMVKQNNTSESSSEALVKDVICVHQPPLPSLFSSLLVHAIASAQVREKASQ